VRELGWWQSFEDHGLKITAVPAAHEGNRMLHDAASHPVAFGGYVIEYAGHSVYFAGDTAYEPALFEQIAERFPKLDLALLPIGPIAPEKMMLEHHMNPEQALRAFATLGAAQLIPVHFATYMHSFDDPGDCEARFDAAVALEPGLSSRAHRLAVGERRVVLPLPPASAEVSSVRNAASRL
jgi:L-ascorbate metabolism protein UlaG (beta-lactamase superfamily)